MSVVRAEQPFPPLPQSIDYSARMPLPLGEMLNDSLGDCAEAAVGHAIQVWTWNARGPSYMVTVPDADILALYEWAGGYVPGDPSTDNGTVLQMALIDWLNGAVGGNELTAFVEIAVNNVSEVHRSIVECALVYIGLNVPQYLMDNLTDPGSVWDIDPQANNTSAGGHCVIATGYDASGNLTVISWGELYTMTPAFWRANVDECYALANKDWIQTTGKTPAGLSLSSLEALMQAMKAPHKGFDAKHEKHAHRQHRRKRRRQRASHGFL